MARARRRTATERPSPSDDNYRCFHIWSHRDIGFIAKASRRSLELRQHELAGKVGVSRQWLSDFEHGKASVEIGLAMRVFKELEIDLFASAAFARPAWTRSLVRGRAQARDDAMDNPRNKRRRVLRQTKKIRARIVALIRSRGPD